MLEWFLTAPGATLVIMAISASTAMLNSFVNRLLITRLVGWSEYKKMQKRIRDYRTLSTQALRSKDPEARKKLQREGPIITQMQKKMMKPQAVMFGLSFSYIFIWIFLLIPTFGSTPIAYLPGIGWISIIWWYPMCSFLFGIVASRLSGIMTESEE